MMRLLELHLLPIRPSVNQHRVNIALLTILNHCEGLRLLSGLCLFYFRRLALEDGTGGDYLLT